MAPLTEFWRAFEEGRRLIQVLGRDLDDLAVDREGQIRPLREMLRNEARARGMHLVTYSLAGGLDHAPTGIPDQRDRGNVEKALQAHGIMSIPQDGQEVVRALRGLTALSRMGGGYRWTDGKPMQFLIVVEHAEHLLPQTSSSPADLVACELVHAFGASFAARDSGNALVLHGREGMMNNLAAQAAFTVRLAQPDTVEKRDFVAKAMTLYSSGRFEDGLDAETAARLSSNTPNRGIEGLLRASHLGRRRISVKELAEQRQRDVAMMSEGTLQPLDTSRVNGSELTGRTVTVVADILQRLAEALSRGDPNMPGQVLLVGPPAGGKTELALRAVQQAKAAGYQMLSPKGSLVGETERRARLQQQILKDSAPSVAFADEITELLPLNRQGHDLDAGASRAVTGELLSALSDDSRRGKTLLVATTNVPGRIGAAMLSRFVVIPVLHPLDEDMPGIIVSIARRVLPGTVLDAADPKIAEAAHILAAKRVNPRGIRSALTNQVLVTGRLDAAGIVEAAHDVAGSTDGVARVYGDLVAIEHCANRKWLPWGANPAAYPYPPYLKEIVDPRSGDVDRQALRRRIAELEPHANI